MIAKQTVFCLTLTLVVSSASVTAAVQQGGESDVDRQLLEALDAVDDELEALPDEPASDAPRKPASDDEPSERQKSLDEELLDQLDEGEDIPLGPDEAEVADLGVDADPLTRIGEKMRLVQKLLVKETPRQRTGKLQQEIVRDLDELLKKLQQQRQQQQASSPQQSKSRQQASRNKIQQPSRQQQSKPGNRQSQKPADQSDQRVRKAETKEIDVAEVTEIIKQIWGHLPEKERERLRQMAADEPLPENSLLIEKYFRRLSEADEE